MDESVAEFGDEAADKYDVVVPPKDVELWGLNDSPLDEDWSTTFCSSSASLC